MFMNLVTQVLAVVAANRNLPTDTVFKQDQWWLVLLLAGLPMMIIGLTMLVAMNRSRYLAVAPSMAWISADYIHHLPNILKLIYDSSMESPWPAKPTAFHARLFRRRLRKLLRKHFVNAKQLAEQHVSLWVFVELHRLDLQELVLRHKIVRLRGLLLNTPDEHLREQLLRRMSRCRQQYELVKLLTPAPAMTSDSVPWLKRLNALRVIFAEHGYQLDTALVELEHWQQARDEELLTEVVSGDQVVAMS